ncbi:MAG: hypothetical protein ACJKSS_01550 [Patescibacteria group bacterium UBA2103]
MNNVQFDDQQQFRTVQKKKGLTQMVINMGLAKDEKGAQVVLLIVGVVALAVMFFFMFSGGGAPAPAELPDPNVGL